MDDGRLKLIAGPEAEPVGADEVQTWTGNEDDGDVALIEARITAARLLVEAYVGVKLITQTWQLRLDCFPDDELIQLPFGPWQTGEIDEVDRTPEISYYDTAGDLQTVDAEDFQFDEVGGRLAPAIGGSWPSTQADKLDAVRVQFVCGFGDAPDSVPELQLLRTAVLATVDDWLTNRAIRFEMPAGVAGLLAAAWGERP
jgi:uncharacterized phiE125 gp8 family phage protein